MGYVGAARESARDARDRLHNEWAVLSPNEIRALARIIETGEAWSQEDEDENYRRKVAGRGDHRWKAYEGTADK